MRLPNLPILVVALASIPTAQGQEVEFTARANPTALVGEPVEVVLTHRNVGSEPIPGVDLRAGFGVQVLVSRDGGPASSFIDRDFLDSWREEREALLLQPLQPGEEREHRFSLSWNAKEERFALDKAGTYHVDLQHPELTPASFEIVVAEPDGANAEALEFLRTKQLSPILSEDAADSIGGDDPRVADLEAFVDRYGSSAYAPGVRRALLALGGGARLDGEFYHRWELGESGESLSVYFVSLRSGGTRPVKIERAELTKGPLHLSGETTQLPIELAPARRLEFRLIHDPAAPAVEMQEFVVTSNDWRQGTLRIAVQPFLENDGK
ncbi:MAG: hypothetical protein HY720_26315 [Planctomycetes bacterium]|nr:hypothetical protein [Planctomycetota bacterium]